jgi:hypothetical protein
MQLYSNLVNSGLSEYQAKAEVTKFLLQEIKYFDSSSIVETQDEALIKKVLGRELTEEERFRLNSLG